MSRPGLPPTLSPVLALPPLIAEQPALRVDLHSRGIIEVSPALARLIGCQTESLVGRPLADLWAPQEREAIMGRFEDVLLLSHDVFGPVALSRVDAPPVSVEVDAAFAYRGGPRLEVRVSPLESTAFEALLPDAVPAAPWPEAAPPADAIARPDPPPAESAADCAESPSPAAAPLSDEGPDPAPELAGPGPVPTERSRPNCLEALALVGAAALAVEADGRVGAATPAAARRLGRPGEALRGQALADLLNLPPAATEALAEARRTGVCQSLVSAASGRVEGLKVEWLPGAVPGTGLAILLERVERRPGGRPAVFTARQAAQVAHDVRDALAAVYCGLLSASEQLPEGHPARATIDQALVESQRAHRIAEDVLTLAGPGDRPRAPIDLDMLLHDMAARFQPRAAARQVALEASLGSGCRVMAELRSLERALANLIENALDATPDGGRISIQSRRETRSVPGVQVAIADTGIGIKEETRPHVFEPFVSDKRSGTGLGLAIAQQVLQDHGGEIGFESQEGSGTTFHLWLPRIEAGSA